MTEDEQKQLDEWALIDAAQCQLFPLINRLKAGANPNARDPQDGKTVLHKSVYSEHSHVQVDEVLSAGADVNAVDREGKTALHHAAQRDYSKTAELLLFHGADTSIRDNYGRTAKDYAPEWSNSHIQFLKAEPDYDGRYGELGDTALHRVAREGDFTGVKIHSTDYGLNDQNIKGETALHVLAPNSPECARLLVGVGLDPNIEDKQGRTALSIQPPENREGMLKGLEDRQRFLYENAKSEQLRRGASAPTQSIDQSAIACDGRKKGGVSR